MRGSRPLLLAVSFVGLGALLLATSVPSAPKSRHRHRAPIDVAQPTVSGTWQPGHVLRVSPGRWSGASKFVYLWKACDGHGAHCIVIRHQTIPDGTPLVSTYRLTRGDIGRTISVTVVAISRWGSTSVTSRPRAVIGPYTLPANRTYHWDPGLQSVGDIPSASRSVYRTISPSGGDDTTTIQAALTSCRKDSVVQLTAGVFRITGAGLILDHSYCTLRGAGPGPGNWPIGTAASGTGGTYLQKPSGTGYPAVVIGPRWGTTQAIGSPISLTSDAVRGTRTVTVSSAAGLTRGQLVIVDELTDPSISHWNSRDPENRSGWFEEPDRPLGDVMQIASVSGHSLTFTTDFPITYQVSRSAHLVPETKQTNYSGIEDLYLYGGEGGDGGGGVHMWNCAYCWIKHVEDTWSGGAAVHVDQSFGDELRDSYFHDSSAGYAVGGGSYGIGLNRYTSNTLIENNIIMRFDKVDVMRSAGGGNVFGYNYLDDGCDGCRFLEDNLNSSHMTTPHYELFEGNQAPNFDQDDRWGNSDYITVFRNQFTGQLRDFLSVSPYRASAISQWHWNQSFVGNVLGTPSDRSLFNNGYESIGGSWANAIWVLCYQASDDVPDGGKCLSTQLRDGNYDYLTRKVRWYGIGGTGVNGGLSPPANSTLPASMYLRSKPAFFGSNPWPWVDGSNAAHPLPGQLPARARYDAGTPNAVP
jgi:hypothetical protein